MAFKKVRVHARSAGKILKEDGALLDYREHISLLDTTTLDSALLEGHSDIVLTLDVTSDGANSCHPKRIVMLQGALSPVTF